MRTRKDAYEMLCEILNHSPAQRARMIERVCEAVSRIGERAKGEVALMIQEGSMGALPSELEIPDTLRSRKHVKAFFAVFDAIAERFAEGRLTFDNAPVIQWEEYDEDGQIMRLGGGCLVDVANLPQVSFDFERIGEGRWTPETEWRVVVAEGPLAFLTVPTRALLQIATGGALLRRCPAPRPFGWPSDRCDKYFVTGATRGNPARYCSDTCRARDFRRRKAREERAAGSNTNDIQAE